MLRWDWSTIGGEGKKRGLFFFLWSYFFLGCCFVFFFFFLFFCFVFLSFFFSC